ncbi:MAG: ABC transporter ATP-binding protein [Acidobacteria bacterium]|nr:ABC transporter ATP-binding protein [Acidobacteriota bacterium]
MIKVENLTKRYARNVAVDGISFEVEKGQIVGFLGPNGAGKTTTMRVLTCFLPPTEGKAEVAGYDVIREPIEVKRRIGYLPETPPLYPEMEVSEYMEFVGKLKGVPRVDLARRVEEACERCHCEDVKAKLISRLSKGYRQRVGLAAAILHNPDVLILDEPTSALDPEQRRETLHLIKELGKEHTIILSTHVLPEVEQTCEKVIIINRGKLVATDTMENLNLRLRGAELVSVEVEGRNGALSHDAVKQKLETVDGVSRVTFKENRNNRLVFTVESAQGRPVRADLARAVVQSDWNLIELHSMGLSLEEIFLQLMASDKAAAGGAK